MSVASYDTTRVGLTVSLQEAFDFFNLRLWEGALPPLVLLIHRSMKTTTGGYYSPGRWRSREEGTIRAEEEKMIERDAELWKQNSQAAGNAYGDPHGWEMAEIALNPESWPRFSDRFILSILVHEMAHHWQQVCRKPPRRGYHDRVWGAEMKRIGLFPSNTSAPGGKETGTQMSHYIIEGGLFALACDELLADGVRITWEAPKPRRGPRAKSKVKYTCPKCQKNAWAKPNCRLKCGDHDTMMIEEDV